MIGILLLIIGIVASILAYRGHNKHLETISNISEYEIKGDTYVIDENCAWVLQENNKALDESKTLKKPTSM